MLWLKRTAPLRDFVNEERLHDLGKLLFAFSTFWMHIFFSQNMRIWYANIAEESSYCILRRMALLDLCLMILPPVTHGKVVLPWMELAMMRGAMGLFTLVGK